MLRYRKNVFHNVLCLEAQRKGMVIKMNRVYAFTDESGAFGWDLAKDNVSKYFVVTSVIVKEQDIEKLREEVEKIRVKNFQKGEMKSAKIGKNTERRKRILGQLMPLPFSIFAVVFDKSQMLEYKGLRYKGSFYKFLNNIVHKELRKAFKILTITADEIGGSEYMKSFSKYVKNKTDIPDLFGEAEFLFENSSNDVLIQLADIICGSIARKYNYSDESYDFCYMLRSKITRIEIYPKTYESYKLDSSALAEDYDKDIAEICLKQAIEFINKYNDSDDEKRIAQIIVLKYMLFRFINNDLRKYIYTDELMKQLVESGYPISSKQAFRNQIIGNLRDNGVIIASSSKGYKIPSKEAEIYDFINHGTSIIIPMLERLKKCRDLIKLGSVNTLDVFDHSEYRTLKKYFDE